MFSILLCHFCVVIRVFSAPPKQPMTSDFEGFKSKIYPLLYFPTLILEKEPEFLFLMFSAKQGNYWYHFYNIFGMTRTLTRDWTWDLPHSKPALYNRGGDKAIKWFVQQTNSGSYLPLQWCYSICLLYLCVYWQLSVHPSVHSHSTVT